MIKIHILFPFAEGPLGGGNQFLKALRGYCQQQGVYTDDAAAADVILFNSFHNAPEVMKARRLYPNKVLVHRVDGAGSIYTNRLDPRDWIVAAFNDACADATVFQSHWSKGVVFSQKRQPSRLETIITNAPDPAIFNSQNKQPLMENGKLRLLMASWSPNREKGFDTYLWLDKHMDPTRVDMVFAGQSPVHFNHIRRMGAMDSRALAKVMRQSDIFITASRNETCPNVLLEALHCGVPAIALDSGAHKEILQGAGAIFKDPYDIPLLIDDVCRRYKEYQNAMTLPAMDQVGKAYIDFCARAFKAGVSKRPAWGTYLYLWVIMKVSYALDNIFYHVNRLFAVNKNKPAG